MSLERISYRDECKLRYYVACHGLGVFFSSFGKILEHQSLYASRQNKCSACGGLGFTDRWPRCLTCHGSGACEPTRLAKTRSTATARPKGTGDTVEIDDYRLCELGEVHRRLALVDQVDPVSVQVLCAWYDHERLSLQDVWEFTSVGKTLAKRHPDWSADQCFTALRQDQQATGDKGLAQLFTEADNQAKYLIKKAALLWNLNR